MKTRQSRRKTAKVSHSRWLAYASASAATALAGSHSAEAAIHYSGPLRVHFPPDENKTKTFPLDPGDYLFFERDTFVFQQALFTCGGNLSDAFRGHASRYGYNHYVSKLAFGENISAGNFENGHGKNPGPGILASSNRSLYSQWGDAGTGYVGFRFNSGAGIQYGWARVRMVGDPENAFTVLDYAYADPGEPIRAGQRRSTEQIPSEGSLGGLALGAVGLLAWRKSRSLTALAKPPDPLSARENRERSGFARTT